MSYDIELGQGDSDSVHCRLLENGTGANLTGATVTLSIKNDRGTVSHDIVCIPGATVAGIYYPASQGGITVNFTDEHTETPGVYFGKLIVTLLGSKNTFPSSGVITIKIHKVPA